MTKKEQRKLYRLLNSLEKLSVQVGEQWEREKWLRELLDSGDHHFGMKELHYMINLCQMRVSEIQIEADKLAGKVLKEFYTNKRTT